MKQQFSVVKTRQIRGQEKPVERKSMKRRKKIFYQQLTVNLPVRGELFQSKRITVSKQLIVVYFMSYE